MSVGSANGRTYFVLAAYLVLNAINFKFRSFNRTKTLAQEATKSFQSHYKILIFVKYIF